MRGEGGREGGMREWEGESGEGGIERDGWEARGKQNDRGREVTTTVRRRGVRGGEKLGRQYREGRVGKGRRGSERGGDGGVTYSSSRVGINKVRPHPS